MRRFVISPIFEIIYGTLFGIFYGGVIGGVIGSLVYILGAVVGVFVGAIIGGVGGFIGGVTLCLIHFVIYLVSLKIHLTTYARILSFGFGFLCTMGVGLFFITSFSFSNFERNILRYPTDVLRFTIWQDFTFMLDVALLLLSSIWAFLASASTMHYMIHYVLDPDYVYTQSRFKNLAIAYYFVRHLTLWGVLIIGAILGGIRITYVSNLSLSSLLAFDIVAILIVVSGGILLIVVIAVCSAMFFGFINRVVFVEFFPHWSEETYTKVAMVCVSIMAGFMGFLCAGILGGVVMGLVFGNATRSCIRNQNGEKVKRIV
jgi:hypothetical protein